ncbi:hypothetical protein JQ604_22705 [Bradyrhizobium jicamae]|uniref:hypothetical protein n=1 Tax=Bradyrhizobium jicamae TaxID=280332 RepID=UPI001BABA6C2|nr:hypothetical protein [Bradyrhizobium jicamae]MBR0755004.1 hypothetical protein [Bradyrhizobium jicamae]
MKLFTGWVAAAALALAATGAEAQQITRTSDFEGPGPGPYAAMPPPEVAPPPRYGYGPTLLPPTEVYTVLREAGFSPLGIPRQRGFVYVISVIDRGGDDGRLVIDARNGRIIRFVPAYRMGAGFNDDLDVSVVPGPSSALLPPVHARAPRPPGAVPHVASRSVPVPKPSPLAGKAAPAPAPAQAAAPAPAQPAPTQQAAVVAPKPVEAQATPQAAAPTIGQAPTPAPVAAASPLPTQEMPKVQGLE